MKKLGIIIGIICLSIILFPTNTQAITLKEYEDQVAKYTKELREKEAKIAKNDQEVAEIKRKIAGIEREISVAEDEIVELEREIEESNEKIKQKEKESKNLMKYFQVVSNENTYLEYIFDATSITDMIYRVSVVEQLTDYNKQLMKELEELIEENNQKKADLKAKNEELRKLKADLKDQQERIEADTSHIEGTIPSTKGQITQYQKLVTYYKNKGCKSGDVIGVTCAVPPKVTSSSSSSSHAGSIIAANGFRFPVIGGSISQAYGHAGHRGVDIVNYSQRCGGPIYPVAAGEVFYVGNDLDNNHAYMVMIVHRYNGRLVFSQYAHVQANIPVRVGQVVNINTPIAYMGSTGNSTGCHLHLEMSTGCGWGYICGYYDYLNHIINPFSYIPSP